MYDPSQRVAVRVPSPVAFAFTLVNCVEKRKSEVEITAARAIVPILFQEN
jgi:hypothetical protein